MKEYVFRLKRGMDLKKSIIEYCTMHQIQSAYIATAVGCLMEVCIRTADGRSIFQKKEEYEIVSLTGTIAENGVHIHISLSDQNLQTIGGHLKDGCIVNTTVELILVELENYKLSREYDSETGYPELVINEVDI